MNKFISAKKAIEIIKDNDVIASSGFRWSGSPELLLSMLGFNYEEHNSPKDLTLIFSSAQGDSVSNGLENLAKKGLLSRVIGGFWGINPKLYELAKNNNIEAYNTSRYNCQVILFYSCKSSWTYNKNGIRYLY